MALQTPVSMVTLCSYHDSGIAKEASTISGEEEKGERMLVLLCRLLGELLGEDFLLTFEAHGDLRRVVDLSLDAG